jgi:hypothetical protein
MMTVGELKARLRMSDDEARAYFLNKGASERKYPSGFWFKVRVVASLVAAVFLGAHLYAHHWVEATAWAFSTALIVASTWLRYGRWS